MRHDDDRVVNELDDDPELRHWFMDTFPRAGRDLDDRDPFDDFFRTSELEAAGIDVEGLRRETAWIDAGLWAHYQKMFATSPPTAAPLTKGITADPRITERRRSGNVTDEFSASGELIRTITHFSGGAVVAEYNGDGQVTKTYKVDT